MDRSAIEALVASDFTSPEARLLRAIYGIGRQGRGIPSRNTGDRTTKTCPGCQETKPISTFPLRPDGRSRKSHCLQCRLAANARRRARKAESLVEHLTPEDIRSIWDRFDSRCYVCSAPAEHLDHVVPLALGGEHVYENLRPACADCNLSKGPKLLEDWLPGRLEALP